MKILCVSRYLAIGGVSGNFEYLKSVLDGLRSSGEDISYFWLDGPVFYRPWYRISGRAVKINKLFTGRGIKIGNWIFSSSFKVWFAGIALVLANQLARYFPWAVPRLRGNVQAATETVIEKNKVLGSNISSASKREMELVASRIHSEKPDILLINYAYLADLAEIARAAGIKSCILTHDVIYESHPSQKSANALSDFQKKVELLQKADALIAIQKEEAIELGKLAPDSVILTVPVPFVASPPKQESNPNLMLFVGSGTGPNANGIRWFLEKVWPLIKASCAAARLRVCGSVCNALQNVPAGVELAGIVPDLASEYEAASLVIAPLLAGSGLKIKIVEAFSHGRPVAATSIGLQGMSEAAGVCAICADEPDEFASACCRILVGKTLREQMSQKALQFARQNFSLEACLKPLLSWMAAVDSGKSKN